MNSFIAAFAALLCLGFTATSQFDVGDINNVIANAAYNKVMPITATDYAGFHHQDTKRLAYLEALLRSRDVSAWPEELRAERLANIERLHAYRLEGKFPINYDHPDKQLPCFFDRDGNLCAVANLIAKSAGMDLVQKINDRYQYATVSEMKMAEIDAWIAQSGLTREEVITIQVPSRSPGGGFVDLGGIRERLSIAPQDSLNTAPASDTTSPTQIEKPIEQVEESTPGLSQTAPTAPDRSAFGTR